MNAVTINKNEGLVYLNKKSLEKPKDIKKAIVKYVLALVGQGKSLSDLPLIGKGNIPSHSDFLTWVEEDGDLYADWQEALKLRNYILKEQYVSALSSYSTAPTPELKDIVAALKSALDMENKNKEDKPTKIILNVTRMIPSNTWSKEGC